MEKKKVAENMPNRKSLLDWNHHNLMISRTLIYPMLNIKDRESSGKKIGDRGGQCFYSPQKTSSLDKTTEAMAERCSGSHPFE